MNPLSILIVEDEVIVAADLSLRLTHAGYQVVGTTGNGAEAVALAEQLRPDLVLMDIGLQGPLDGIEAAHILRTRCRLPVVFVTAYAERATLERAKEAEPLGYVLKPFEDRELAVVIELAHAKHLTERKLEESEEKFRAIANYTADWESWFGPDGKYLWVSPSVERFTGYSPSEILAWPDFIPVLIAEEDRALVRARFEEALRGGAGENLEFRYLHKHGAKRWLSVAWQAIHDARGQSIGFRVSGHDITERKQAEEAIARTAREWQTTFAATNDAIWLLDAEHRVLRANKLANEVFPCACGGVIGRRCWEVVHGTTGPVPGCPVERARQSLRRETMELQIGERWYLVTADPILDAADQYAGAVHIVSDTTERKQAEAAREQLQAQRWQLHKAESLGRMAGAIAHHFNNQLQAVMLNLELARSGLPRGAEPFQHFTAALQSARQAATVSSLMLTYLGQTTGQRQRLDLAAACQRSVSLLRAILPPRVALEPVLPVPGPAIRADGSQLHQVLTNLITNAGEACGADSGTVRLAVQTVAAADLPTRHRFPVDWQPQTPTYACLEVADTGCGIAEPNLADVFDPFYTTKFIGRGLGLSVALGIVRVWDGAISVTSEPGRGSVFRVWLPLSDEVAAPPPIPVVPASAPAGSRAVLVVEDEPILRQTLQLVLAALGYKVLIASDGIEALALFQQQPDEIGCVLCDLSMPRMNGWETLTALRQHTPDLPVILCSGYSEAQIMEGEHSELPHAILTKPYETAVLTHAINQALASRKHANPKPR